MLAIDSSHHDCVKDRQVNILILGLREYAALELLELMAVVDSAAKVDLLADFVDGVIEELRHVEPQLEAHGELTAHLVASFEQAPDSMRIDNLFLAFIEGDPCAVLLVRVAHRRKVSVLIYPPLFGRQRLDEVLEGLLILYLNLNASVVEQVAPQDVKVQVDVDDQEEDNLHLVALLRQL